MWRAGVDGSRAELQANRGWSDDEWEAARVRLTERGWLDPAGQVTPDGAARHRAMEATTDRAAADPWSTLGADACTRLIILLEPLAVACGAALPYPNPIGVPDPAVRAG